MARRCVLKMEAARSGDGGAAARHTRPPSSTGFETLGRFSGHVRDLSVVSERLCDRVQKRDTNR